MKLEIYLDKPLEHSAALYFERSKKAKKKMEGAKIMLDKAKKELANIESEKEEASQKLAQEKEDKSARSTKTEWYEKFRWFHSSEGFLCIGGRDSTSNEIIVKKHADEGDIVFHTKIEGSPFFIIKSEGKKIGDATLEETAQATASYSKGWKLGMPSLETFHVKPEQLTKSAPSGEYLTKGAFAVIGKMNLMQVNLEVAVGIKEGKAIGGPVQAIKKNAEKYVVIQQGKEGTSQLAKQIQKKIGGGSVDDIIKFIPAGGAKLSK
jgi:predicted ribosome quality control (RQC) complex YloA/Tae2 family protein